VIQPQAVMERACPGTLYLPGARVPLGQYLMLWTLSDRRLPARVQCIVCSVSLAIAALVRDISGAQHSVLPSKAMKSASDISAMHGHL
jgi:hypothetical protein